MNKKLYFAIFIMMAWANSQSAYAQVVANVTSFYGETPDVNEEDESDDDLVSDAPPSAADSKKNPDLISEESEGEGEREVSLDEDEIRELFDYGASLGVGSSIPWQIYRIGLHFEAGSEQMFTLYSGYSTFHMRGAYEEKNYDMTAKTRGMNFAMRRYLNSILPMIFIQGGLGYYFWTGDIKPQGADTEGSTTPSSLVRASFNGHGPSIFVGLGLSSIWENGFYLEYTLFSFSYSHPWSLEFEHNDSTIKKIINKNLKDPMAWGFNNIAIGYFF